MGTQEVGNAILASTFTTIVVFLPIVFTEGMAGEIFKELALTIAFSLLASLIVALSFIPMLSSKFLKVATPHESLRNKWLDKIFYKWDQVINGIDQIYRKVLIWVLKHKGKTLAIVFSIFVLSLLFYLYWFRIFSFNGPGMFSVDIEMPKGSLIENTNEVAKELEKLLFRFLN